MTRPPEAAGRPPAWTPGRRPWGWADAVALAAWTAAVAAFFWDAVSLRGALFYFDITEINYPYREFFARELRAGRFSRWFPGLYCGMPLYSESQAGYLHPLKYLLYPFLETWQAFNLDTVGSVWLTGLGAYGWLRRHVGPAGALTGAGLFGLSGFVWAHLIHTSMTNALASVPLAFWALEVAWDGGRVRALALGAAAVACQVFAGHLQDTLLTGLALGLYGLHRAATERGAGPRAFALGAAVGMVLLGGALAAVQWVPSLELLGRSPRAGGLSWDDLTYGSWHPELLPTLVLREAYGTRARDTDWMDGYYPYHEMNAYEGAAGLALALLGAAAFRDRWVSFWVSLAIVGGLFMLGRYTFLFDSMHRVPVLGSSRIPVRYHLWVSLAVAALAAVGVDRLSRPGRVRVGWAWGIVAALVLASVPILLYAYSPIWTEPGRFRTAPDRLRSRWLVDELTLALARTVALGLAALIVSAGAGRSSRPGRRRALAAILPVLVIADLLGAHWRDVPTVDPSYWTTPPPTAARLKADPGFVRLFSPSVIAGHSAGEPGYASNEVDVFAARDSLAWSLAPVWGLRASTGETPIIPLRTLAFGDNARPFPARISAEAVTHLLAGRPGLEVLRLFGEPEPVGSAYVVRNRDALPRARLMGRPVYAADRRAAGAALRELGPAIRDRLVVEDPERPLPPEADASGTAAVVVDEPERVEVVTDSAGPSYLVLADTFDPGWSAAIDGRDAPIRPAQVAFRAVFVPAGRHRVSFRYVPAGFRLGLLGTGLGAAVALFLIAWPRRVATLAPAHGDLGWPRAWPAWAVVIALLIVAGSTVELGPDGSPRLSRRWRDNAHRFTWGAGIEAIRPPRPPVE